MKTAKLFNRGVIRLSGPDKFDFLQGIVTQDMRLVSAQHAVYSCFLTPQGRYLADFFIIQQGDDWLFELDHRLIDDLIKRMSIYKLRSKVAFEDVSNQYAVYAFWDGIPTLLENHILYQDPRFAHLGYRMIVSHDAHIEAADNYNAWRLQNGIPEFGKLVPERSLMLESNMDLLHAISFDKGCYMGQEVTARTHYRALLKKALLPVRFEDGTIILTLVPLENLHDGDTVTIDGQTGNVFFPDWFTRQ